MKSIKIAGPCLVAVFACSAIVAASASGSKPERPEYFKCEKAPKVSGKYTGEFSNKECTKATSDGKYKLTRLAESKEAFTGKSKGATFTFGGKTVKCKRDTDKGELDGAVWTYETIIFAGCDVNGKKNEPCENITTHRLFGELYYTSKEETAADIDVSGGRVFTEIKCGTETFVIEGQLVGTVTNSKSGQAITFAINGKGEQAQKQIWEEEEEYGKFTLEYKGKEATLQTTEAEGPKGVGVFF